LVTGGLKILEDTLEGMLVVRARVSGVAAEGRDGVAKVGVSP